MITRLTKSSKSLVGINQSSSKTKSLSSAFLAAAGVSGISWYFVSQNTEIANNRQRELIRRVEADETADDFLTKFNYLNVDDWECKKVTLDVVLNEGRYVIKRAQSNTDGYLVLAPIVVSKSKQVVNTGKAAERKFIINLGWVPKTSKHLIPGTQSSPVLEENDYTSDPIAAMEKETKDGLNRNPFYPNRFLPISTVSAYIRRGEKEDIKRGRKNFPNLYVFKLIDLWLFARLGRITNLNEGTAIYLDRAMTSEQNADLIPVPKSKEQMLHELNEEINYNNQCSKDLIQTITGVSFGIASIAALFATI